MRPYKILIMGLPTTGKTTLATALAPKLKAVHLNADEIRREINKDLKFSTEDRIEQARRMGVLCDIVNRAGHTAIADFVCPTKQCHSAFNSTLTIWVDRIKESPYKDTNLLFEEPQYDIRLSAGTVEEWIIEIEAYITRHY